MATKVNRLTDKDDQTMALLFVEQGKTVKQISDFTGWAESTIYAHLKKMGLIVEEKKDEPKHESSISLDALVEVLKSIDGHLSAMGEALEILALREDKDPLSATSQR